jgi:hypothetical protein
MKDIFGANGLRYCKSVPQEQSVAAPAAALLCQSSRPDTSTALATFQEQSAHSGDIRNLKKVQASAGTCDVSRLPIIRKESQLAQGRNKSTNCSEKVTSNSEL